MADKHLYIIAGCNGAGKTTASMTLLPKSLLVKEFVNADEIARGLSPFNPEGVAIEAGKLMLQRIDFLLEKEESFSIETTLATKSYLHLVHRAHQKGYVVHIIFFWLNTPEHAIIRVSERVRQGGHGIPIETIKRRYVRGISNLFKLYMKEVDIWSIYDNSEQPRECVAYGGREIETIVYSITKYERIKKYVK